MERGQIVFATLFVLVPLVLVLASILTAGAAAFWLMLATIVLLSTGFMLAIAFVDVA